MVGYRRQVLWRDYFCFIKSSLVSPYNLGLKKCQYLATPVERNGASFPLRKMVRFRWWRKSATRSPLSINAESGLHGYNFGRYSPSGPVEVLTLSRKYSITPADVAVQWTRMRPRQRCGWAIPNRIRILAPAPSPRPMTYSILNASSTWISAFPRTPSVGYW